LAIFTALGINFVLENKKLISYFLSPILVFVIFIFSWYFSYFKVRDYYQYSQELVQEAKILNDLTRPEDKIVTDRMGDTTLLYLADRRGAPAIFKEPIELKTLGYKYLITSNDTQKKRMGSDYEIVFENDKFTLYAL